MKKLGVRTVGIVGDVGGAVGLLVGEERGMGMHHESSQCPWVGC